MRELYRNFRWFEDDSPQSMLVENGVVLERGVLGEINSVDASFDLEGALLHPAFVDSHCHILPTGLDLQKLNLGSCDTPEEVLQAVADRNQQMPEGEWLRAVLYDQTKFHSGEHLTRDDLDRISASRPIVLRHVNGHASIANTAALLAAGVTEDEPDPAGGTFVRDASGRITGVLLEHAHERVFDAGPKLRVDQMVEAILAAGHKMSELGIVAASDMMTGRYDLLSELDAYVEAARQGCPIRTRLYVQWGTVFGPRGIGLDRFVERANTIKSDSVRVAGIKIFADGAIGSKTAGIYGSYQDESPSETSGKLIYSPERLIEMVKTASDAGFQVCVHSIGDWSTDKVLDAFEASGDPSRHRIEHVMLLSDAQIDRIARLGCFATMQPEFLMRLGHAYRRNLGEARAARLKRANSCLKAGVKLSFSSDRPIVSGNPRDGIQTATRRPEGFDSSENVRLRDALRLYSASGDEVNGDHPSLLMPGQRAQWLTT
ncbi:MAG TPA: amidohydrolase [Fimbriimonadaceae bacterium]|nr:amidohydrolase [Fimbriimonadaceae bacterium]